MITHFCNRIPLLFVAAILIFCPLVVMADEKDEKNEKKPGPDKYLIKLDGPRELLNNFHEIFKNQKFTGKFSDACEVYMPNTDKSYSNYIDYFCVAEAAVLTAYGTAYANAIKSIQSPQELSAVVLVIPKYTGYVCILKDGGVCSNGSVYCPIDRQPHIYHDGQKNCSNHVCIYQQ